MNARIVLSVALLWAAVNGATAKTKVDIRTISGQPNFDTYSGYLNATSNGREQYHFYVLTESQTTKADTDPLILWLNGGPGCSSLGGLFEELGPFHNTKDGKGLWENAYAWNKVGHVLYMESPAGVGFSYSADDNIDTDDDKTADANYAALFDFFEQYPKFKKRDFYIAGESYGGVYIPTLAERVVKSGKFKTTFKGMAIGNGMLSAKHQQNSVFYLLYYRGAIGYKQWEELNLECCNSTTTTCNYFKHLRPVVKFPRNDSYVLDDSVSDGTKCGDLGQKLSVDLISYSEVDQYNQYQDCYKPNGAQVAMHKAAFQSFMAAAASSAPQLNYDSTDQFGGFPCWNDKALTAYMTDPDVVKKFNVSSHSLTWASCNPNFVNGSYHRTYWDMSATMKYIVDNSDARILIYNGDVDWVCNFLGDEWFMRELAENATWNVTKDRQAWHYRGQIAGYVETYYDRIDLLTVKGAGHFVPASRPGPALQMIANFVNDVKNYTKSYDPSLQTTVAPPTTTTKGAAGTVVGLCLIVVMALLCNNQ